MPVKKDKSPETIAKQEAVADRFKRILRDRGIAEHGAQTHIAKEVGVSDATVAAWMRGSLPRDPAVLFRFCDVFGVDPYWWSTGEARPRDKTDEELCARSLLYVSKQVKAKDLDLQPEVIGRITARVMDDWKNREEITEGILRLLQPSSC